MKRDFLVGIRGNKTQSEVAIASDLSRSMYTQIETGDRTPSVATAKRIAEVLGFDWILFFEDEGHDTCHMKEDNNGNNTHDSEKCSQYPKRCEKGNKEITASSSV
jgi:putative transcriptional regulator